MQWEHDDAIRAVLRRARIVEVNDKGSQQRVDVRGMAKDKPKKLWRIQDYGSTSVPPKDSDGYLIPMGGRSDRALYVDGGHEKYRPKRTPEGCKAIFNMHGDIIRVFKDSTDVVHQKKLNIRIGKGYKAGEGGDGEGGGDGIDDESDQDTATLSIVLEADQGIELDFEGNKITIENGKITCLATERFAGGVDGMWVNATASRVNLGVSGPDGTAANKVATEAGLSSKVYAEI